MTKSLPKIQPPKTSYDESPWAVPETPTILEAALAYCDAHPHTHFLGDLNLHNQGDRNDRLRFFGLQDDDRRDSRRPPNVPARDIYFQLIHAVKTGKIVPVESAWVAPGEPDPFRTRIRLSDLVEIARHQGTGGMVMKRLMRWPTAIAPSSSSRKPRRGPRPIKRDLVVKDMQADLTAEKFTVEQLSEMTQESLRAQYHNYSRQTVSEARTMVVDNQLKKPRQTPNTNK